MAILSSLFLIISTNLLFKVSDSASAWINREVIPVSYFSANTANVLRCENLCKRQARCGAVSFDIRQRVCHLHEINATISSNTSKGVYKFLNLTSPKKEELSNHCKDTDILLSSARKHEGTCLDLQDAQVQAKGESSVAISNNASVQINPCKFNQTFNGSHCICQKPLTGKYCDIGPRDCRNNTGKRWFDIYPEDGIDKMRIFCFEESLVLFVAPTQGFLEEHVNASWDTFKTGFGDIRLTTGHIATHDYWLGNDKIHRITNGTITYKLVYFAPLLPSGAEEKLSFYHDFYIDDEANNYTTHYSSYGTNGGADQTLPNNAPFRTFDRNSNRCVNSTQSSFWFNDVCDMPPTTGSILCNASIEYYLEFWAGLV